jgi:hypothetical protein
VSTPDPKKKDPAKDKESPPTTTKETEQEKKTAPETPTKK